MTDFDQVLPDYVTANPDTDWMAIRQVIVPGDHPFTICGHCAIRLIMLARESLSISGGDRLMQEP